MEFSIDLYDVGQLVGSGGFGRVFRARERESSRDVAIKIVGKDVVESSALLSQRMAAEVSIHTKVRHRNLVKVLSVFDDQHYIYMVMELCAYGNLYKYFQTNYFNFTSEIVSHTIAQLLGAINYLHTNKIVHRDVKLSNILISDISNRGLLTIKLCDFGLAMEVGHPDEEHFTFCGTYSYMPPELMRLVDRRRNASGNNFNDRNHRGDNNSKNAGVESSRSYHSSQKFSFKEGAGSSAFDTSSGASGAYGLPRDIWSVGLTAKKLLSKTINDGNDIDNCNGEGEVSGNQHVDACPESPSDVLGRLGRQFVAYLLRSDPAERPTAGEALAHPFITSTSGLENGVRDVFRAGSVRNSFSSSDDSIQAFQDQSSILRFSSINKSNNNLNSLANNSSNSNSNSNSNFRIQSDIDPDDGMGSKLRSAPLLSDSIDYSNRPLSLRQDCGQHRPVDDAVRSSMNSVDSFMSKLSELRASLDSGKSISGGIQLTSGNNSGLIHGASSERSLNNTTLFDRGRQSTGISVEIPRSSSLMRLIDDVASSLPAALFLDEASTTDNPKTFSKRSFVITENLDIVMFLESTSFILVKQGFKTDTKCESSCFRAILRKSSKYKVLQIGEVSVETNDSGCTVATSLSSVKATLLGSNDNIKNSNKVIINNCNTINKTNKISSTSEAISKTDCANSNYMTDVSCDAENDKYIQHNSSINSDFSSFYNVSSDDDDVLIGLEQQRRDDSYAATDDEDDVDGLEKSQSDNAALVLESLKQGGAAETTPTAGDHCRLFTNIYLRGEENDGSNQNTRGNLKAVLSGLFEVDNHNQLTTHSVNDQNPFVLDIFSTICESVDVLRSSIPKIVMYIKPPKIEEARLKKGVSDLKSNSKSELVIAKCTMMCNEPYPDLLCQFHNGFAIRYYFESGLMKVLYRRSEKSLNGGDGFDDTAVNMHHNDINIDNINKSGGTPVCLWEGSLASSSAVSGLPTEVVWYMRVAQFALGRCLQLSRDAEPRLTESLSRISSSTTGSSGDGTTATSNSSNSSNSNNVKSGAAGQRYASLASTSSSITNQKTLPHIVFEVLPSDF